MFNIMTLNKSKVQFIFKNWLFSMLLKEKQSTRYILFYFIFKVYFKIHYFPVLYTELFNLVQSSAGTIYEWLPNAKNSVWKLFRPLVILPHIDLLLVSSSWPHNITLVYMSWSSSWFQEIFRHHALDNFWLSSTTSQT